MERHIGRISSTVAAVIHLHQGLRYIKKDIVQKQRLINYWGNGHQTDINVRTALCFLFITSSVNIMVPRRFFTFKL